MANCKKLLEKISNNPLGVRFADLTKLLECHGFELGRHKGTSHRIYTHPGINRPLNIQNTSDGKAKPYQVRQVLEAIEAISGNY